MHAAVCKRFDKLCQKASSITGGVAELQSRLLVHKDGEADILGDSGLQQRNRDIKKVFQNIGFQD